MLEFMPEPDAPKLAEQIVAFANALGGIIVVGMDERKRIHADAIIDLEPILGRALDQCAPPFEASDVPEWHLEELPNGHVVTIAVKPTPYPLSVASKGMYVRSGTLNIRMSPEQAARGERGRYTLAYESRSFEENGVPGATLADFDEDIIEEYRRNRIKRGPRGEAFTRTELLRDAGAVDASGQPTVAGILLFGRYPERFFPQVGVVVVRFPGTSIVAPSVKSTERYSSRAEFVGPAARLVERTWEALFKEIHVRVGVKPARSDSPARQETYEYPSEAVREAVVNAICHRDYAISGRRIEIHLFQDRLEIISPGGLPGHVTLDNIFDTHYSRNPRLVRGLYCWAYIEEMGQGMDIIRASLRRDHHPDPELKAAEQTFTVILRNAVDEAERDYGEQFNPRQVLALKFLEANERITNRQYQELCPNVSPETLRLDLRDLVEKRILLRIGDKRGTYYVRK
jgi:ATP-dependent DNA helicase RecG